LGKKGGLVVEKGRSVFWKGDSVGPGVEEGIEQKIRELKLRKERDNLSILDFLVDVRDKLVDVRPSVLKFSGEYGGWLLESKIVILDYLIRVIKEVWYGGSSGDTERSNGRKDSS